MDNELRKLPGVDRVLFDERIKQLENISPHELWLDVTRRETERIRQSIMAGNPCPSLDEIVESVVVQVHALLDPGLRPVINASGVIIHTNLGRARLSEEAIAAMSAVAGSYSNLEFDLDRGVRGSRTSHVEPLLCQLTGAEAALVVNNNASGVLLALTALTRRKEVVVSRSQAVEIGGGFRIPAVMRQSGAKLIEVGTTNCTYIDDYEQAISPRTAALMRVHSSNFKVVGFVHSVGLDELVALGNRHGLPVFDDVGSGCFMDTTNFGLTAEPMVPQSIALGAGLVLFSGDKLLGGPQAGIIVGREHLIARLRKHPLARAVRVDKMSLAGLAATLVHYLKGEAMEKIPLWRMIAAPLAEIERRAAAWAEAASGLSRVMDGETMVGGGSLPGGSLPTRLVAIGGGGKKRSQDIQGLARKLRLGEPPVIGRIAGDTLLLDPRTVLPEEDDFMLRALRGLTSEGG